MHEVNYLDQEQAARAEALDRARAVLATRMSAGVLSVPTVSVPDIDRLVQVARFILDGEYLALIEEEKKGTE